MDTKKDAAASEVPTFKVARVGNDRKRKGGGFSFLRGGGTRGVWSGAAGGSGAGGATVSALGLSLSKAMLIIMVSSLAGSAAIYYGAHSAASTKTSAKKPQIFSQDRDAIKIEGDTSNLPSNANTIPNSMGYVTGSRDGLTPEERAKRDADAAAAAEAQRIADEEAARKAEKDNLAGAPVDPNALLASAKADGGKGGTGGGGFGKKFGALSSSFGGGSALSGGAGMSGGVNRQFGSSGSITKGAGGQMAAMRGSTKVSSAKSAASRLAASRTKGFARRQLANTNAYSRRASAAGKGEGASADAASAFDNNPGAGNVISGPGVSKGAAPQSGGGDTTNGGGPTGGGGDPTVDCGANNYQAADGSCKPIKTDNGQDANPALTMMANIVMGLLLLIGVMAAIACALDATVYGATVSGILKTAIIAAAAIVTLLGLAMVAQGDYVAGGLATLIGGITTYMAWGATATLTGGQAMIAGFGGAAVMMVGKMLGGSSGKDKAPEAAQQ